MIYVYPTKPRSSLMRYLMWPLVFVQTFLLHPKLGLGYALEWSNKSLIHE